MSTNIVVSNHSNIRVAKPKLATNPVVASVASGNFYHSKPVTVREMVIRRINKTLCIFLLFTVIITFISYYIAMNFEAKLNYLDREIVKINDENLELQADLDRYKSFNNVDSKIGEFKLLQKADKVLEVTAMASQQVLVSDKKNKKSTFNWAIGY